MRSPPDRRRRRSAAQPRSRGHRESRGEVTGRGHWAWSWGAVMGHCHGAGSGSGETGPGKAKRRPEERRFSPSFALPVRTSPAPIRGGNGAAEWTRTTTTSRSQVPETCASTNSATAAKRNVTPFPRQPPFGAHRQTHSDKAVVRLRGLEPPRGFPHSALNAARLPIPPQPRGSREQPARGLPRRPAQAVLPRPGRTRRRI